MFFELDLNLMVAFGCCIGHSHCKSTGTTKYDQGAHEKWYTSDLLRRSYYHIVWSFALVAKVAFFIVLNVIFVKLSYSFFDQKVQHCGQACLQWYHMVLGVMVLLCSNFLAFLILFLHSLQPFFFFLFVSYSHAFSCLRSSAAKNPGWLDTAVASRDRSFGSGSSSGKVRRTSNLVIISYLCFLDVVH